MNRKNNFEKSKITKVSTNKVCSNFYFDAFTIEKLRMQNADYNAHTQVEYYLDFEDAIFIANDVASGKFFKDLEAHGNQKTYMSGSPKSKDYDYKPESRVLSFTRVPSKDPANKPDTIFINISRGPGKLTDTGAITPAGNPDLKIGVPVELPKFRSMFMITHDYICAYLAKMVNQLVRECEEARKNANEAESNNTTE